MLIHASIAVEDPRRTAEAIAELWSGRAYPFPFIAEGSWAALAGDPHGSMIEVLPRGTCFRHIPGEHVDIGQGGREGASGFHLLIGSPHDPATIIAIAARHGHTAHEAVHGELPLVEMWIDGCVLLEVMPPAVQAAYAEAVTIERAEAMVAAMAG
jgi:hypothetical protein